MITAWTDLFADLQGILAEASGINADRVILADQGRPPPANPEANVYATYKPIPVRAYGQPRKDLALVDAVESYDASLGSDWQDFEETTVTQLEVMVSCNFIGGAVADGAARDAAWQVQSASHRLPVFERLRTAGLAWRKAGEVRDLTEVIQGGFLPRYQVDVDLFTEAGVTDEILRAAAFSFDLEDRDGNIIASGSDSI